MSTSSLTDSLLETLSAFDDANRGVPLTTNEVAERLGIGRRGTYSRLRRLADRGEIETKKVGARGRVWWRPPARGSDAGTADADPTTPGSQALSSAGSSNDVEAELRQAVERIDDGFYAIDDEWRLTYVNERTVETTGFAEEDVLGANVWETFTPLEGSMAEEKCREAMATGEPMAFEDYLEVTDEWFEIRLFPSESGLSVYFKDVTEQKERERALAESERRNRTLVDNFPNGVIALYEHDLRHTLVGGEVFELVDLAPDEIEGRTVREIFPPDVVDDIEPHFAAVFDGERREFDVEAGSKVRHFRTMPVRDEDGEIVAGLGMSQDVTEQRGRQRELERQRERLTALNDLNDVVREVVDAVVGQSTREEIESVVSERLASSDSYLFAWIGDVDLQSGSVTVRTEAGVDDALDGEATIADLAAGGGAEPTMRAYRDGEIQAIQDLRAASDGDGGPDAIRTHGVRATAAVPIHHDGNRYGVLNVYADRPSAFTEDEQALICQLGEVVGQAISGAERKRALMSDEVVEAVFVVEEIFDAFDVPVSFDGSIDFDRTVSIGGDSFLVYGSATDEGMAVVDAIVEAAAVPYWDSLKAVGSDGDESRFELRMTEPPVLTTIAAYGANVQEMWIEGGDYYSRIHLPPSRAVRHVLEAIERVYPNVQLLTQRQVSRDDSTAFGAGATARDELTDGQHAALQAAYHSGYFEWPRGSDGEDVAASLGVDPSTFHYHLRNAQRRTLGGVLDPSSGG